MWNLALSSTTSRRYALLIHYISYDRFPAPKGASVHIDAFVGYLAKEFGSVFLTTVATGVVPQGPLEDSTIQLSERQEIRPGVWHRGIAVQGKNLIQRVASFRQQLEQGWPSADVVHFRSIWEGYPLARQKVSSDEGSFGPQLVYEVNGLPSIELKYHYPAVADDREFLAKLRHQEQVCLEAADLVVTVSQVNAEHLCSRGVAADKIRIIPNGVDTETFRYQQPRAMGECIEMLYVGTLASWQGIRVALEALALIRRDAPARLTIIGDARHRQRRDLDRAAERLGVLDAMQILPPQSQSELAEAYHGSDVVLAPLMANDRNRVQGCCPLKVLEAMSSGTPLIASDIEVVRVLARDGIDASLVRPGCGKAIKDAVFKLRDQPKQALARSASARRRVKQHFTWGQAGRRLVEAYHDVLKIETTNRKP